MNSARPAFGVLLRKLRVAARLSQEGLAERARISAPAVSALERGARRAPQRQTLDLLVAALGLESAQRAELEAAAKTSVKARIRDALPPSPTTQLPNLPTSFIGRERERNDIGRAIAAGRCTTVWGSAGVGKTRLVLETARFVERRFPAGVWFVELASLAVDADVARAIAAATNVLEEDDRPLAESLAEALAGKVGLLVLDNAEHVLAGCAKLVERLVRDAPSVAIICTSREPLRIGGEEVYPLEPLPIPNPDDDALVDAPAIRLFRDRAVSAGAALDKQPETLRAIAEICRRLDAIPLALELAAARAPLMSASQIVAGLDDRFRLLSTGNRDVAARQRTLRQTLDWSVALVSETERIVLRRLAVWPGTWTLDDAVSIADAGLARWDVIDAVGRLVDRSLVVASASVWSGERRYRLLQSTLAYAADRLTEAGEFETGQRLQAERIRDLAETASEAWRTGDDLPFRALETAPIRAALRFALGPNGDAHLGALIAGHAAMFWETVGMQREGLRWIDDALGALPEHDAPARMQALLGKSRICARLHLKTLAYEAAAEAVVLAARSGDAKNGAWARLLQAEPASAIGRREEGRSCVEDAAAQFERIGDSRGREAALWQTAFLAFIDGRYAECRERLEPLIERARRRDERRLALQGLIDLAETEFALGNTNDAIARGYEALETARELNATLLIGASMQNIAAYLLEAGNIDEAIALARESLELASAFGYVNHVCYSMGHLADALARTGHVREAAVFTGYADEQFRMLGSSRQGTEARGYARVQHAFARFLDPSDLARALREGAALDAETAVDLALHATSDRETDAAS